MLIQGLQKMTLLDYPGKVACTVFLAGCDLRCPFCHNSELWDMNAPAVCDDEELIKFLAGRKGLLEGVVFTGGEPLLRKDLPELIARVKELGYPVKLDTNGNHPDRLKDLIDRGLIDYVAMDIKNSLDRYAVTCGLDSMDTGNVEESVRILMSGDLDYEFRTTVVDELHDERSFEDIGRWLAGAKRYYLQPFTDRDTVLYAGFHAPEAGKLEKYREAAARYIKDSFVRGE